MVKAVDCCFLYLFTFYHLWLYLEVTAGEQLFFFSLFPAQPKWLWNDHWRYQQPQVHWLPDNGQSFQPISLSLGPWGVGFSVSGKTLVSCLWFVVVCSSTKIRGALLTSDWLVEFLIGLGER